MQVLPQERPTPNPESTAITTFIDLKSIDSRYVFFSMSHYGIYKLVKQEFF